LRFCAISERPFSFTAPAYADAYRRTYKRKVM